MLGPLDGVDTQGEAHRRGGQHGQVVVAARRRAGQRREDVFSAHLVQVGVQQHRAGVAAPVHAGRGPGRTNRRPGEPGHHRLRHHRLRHRRLRRRWLDVGRGRDGVIRAGHRFRGLGLDVGVAGRGQGVLYGGRAYPGEELADHRAGHLQLVGDGLLGPPRPCPHLGLGDLAAGELRWPAAAVADQGGRTALAGPAAKHRHVGRGEPKEEGHLVDPAAGVGQCHDRQVAHPGVVRLVPVNQRPPVGHQYLPIGGQKTQRGRLRHPLQLALSHAFSLSQSQRVFDDMARRKGPAHRAFLALLEEV